MSLRRDILNAFVTLLNGVTKPGGVPDARVRRSLPESIITQSEINVYFVAEDVTVKGGRFGPIVTRDVRIIVECRAVTTDPEQIDPIMDPLTDWAVESIMGGNNLGGLAIDVVELGTTWTPHFMDKYYPVTRTSFVVSFQTSRKNSNSVS